MKAFLIVTFLIIPSLLLANDDESATTGNKVDISIDDIINELDKGNTDVLDDSKVALRSIHFNTGKSILTETDKTYLDSLADYLKLIPTIKLSIEGYTDNVGSYYNNKILSEKRSKAVQVHLNGLGIPEDQASSAGYGPEKAIASNNTVIGREKNRRVELHFLSSTVGGGRGTGVSDSKNTPFTTIRLANGQSIKAEFFMFSPDGETVNYKETMTSPMKRLRRPTIQAITLPNGSPYDLSKAPREVHVTPTKNQKFDKETTSSESLVNKGKSVSVKEPSTSIDPDGVDNDKFAITLERILNRTFLFGQANLNPLNTKNASYSLSLNENTINAHTKGASLEGNKYGLGISVGLEHEIEKNNKPILYGRVMYQYGFNSEATFNSQSIGLGIIAGKYKQFRLGADIGMTKTFTNLGDISVNNLSVNNVTYNETIKLRYKNTFATICPNISYEYKARNYDRATVRITVGFPISARMSSRIEFKGSKTKTLPLTSEIVNFKEGNITQTEYTASSFTGVFVGFGYVFK